MEILLKVYYEGLAIILHVSSVQSWRGFAGDLRAIVLLL
jgi:hypothetical protein